MTQKTVEELIVTRGSDLDQGSRRYWRQGQISFIIFTIKKYRIGDYRIYSGLVFKSLETILMIGVIRNSLLQGLFRKYYGVECKHPSVYSKDIVEIVWQTETDWLILGYLRCLPSVSDTPMSLSFLATWSQVLYTGFTEALHPLRLWVTTRGLGISWYFLGAFKLLHHSFAVQWW